MAAMSVMLGATGLFCLSRAAAAAPVDDTLQQELLQINDRYGKLILAGKLADAARLRTPKPQAEMLAMARKPKRDQAETMAMARLTTPDTVAPVHANLSTDGTVATIEGIAAKTWGPGVKMANAPAPGSVTHAEVTLRFARVGQSWKLLDQSFGADPAKIAACTDTPMEAEADYDTTISSNVGGQIRRVAFKPDHTLVVIRIVDEENCLILPARDGLLKNGIKVEKFVPWATIEIDGAPSRTDKQRFWANRWTVTDEE